MASNFRIPVTRRPGAACSFITLNTAERWTSRDEENRLLEVAEDTRLRGPGIDPDADSAKILFELERRAAEYARQDAEGEEEPDPAS